MIPPHLHDNVLMTAVRDLSTTLSAKLHSLDSSQNLDGSEALSPGDLTVEGIHLSRETAQSVKRSFEAWLAFGKAQSSPKTAKKSFPRPRSSQTF